MGRDRLVDRADRDLRAAGGREVPPDGGALTDVPRVHEVTDAQLSATLMARQGLLVPLRISAAVAVRRLTPLQAQEPNAPYVALHARVDGFGRAGLQRALRRRTVVKTTINRATLHLVAAVDYPAYAQLWRQPSLRAWRTRHPGVDEERVLAGLATLLSAPRSAAEIRELAGELLPAERQDRWEPAQTVRVLLPLVQVPPAGFWGMRRAPRFVLDHRPLPAPDDAAALVVARYLAAFGPATRQDVAAWLGVAIKDFQPALPRLSVKLRIAADGRELLDVRTAPLLGGDERLPVRLLARWDQALLAYDDRRRIFPADVDAAAITLSGAQVVLVDGQVAATWSCRVRDQRAELDVQLLRDVPRDRLNELRQEAARTALAHLPNPAAGSAAVRIVG